MIDLAGITKGAINVGFSVAGQITQLGSYVRVGGTAAPEYDPEAGTVDEKLTTITNVRGMILQFKAKEIDGEKVRTGDEKVLVRTQELTGLSEPARDDRFIVGSVRRDVIEFKADPTRTFWILHCRRFSN